MTPTIDPTHLTALHSLDLGNILSMDGRAHPFDAMTPVSLVEVPATQVPAGTQTGQQVSAASVAASLLPDPSSFFPAHFGARMAVGVIAVVLVLIVAARLIL